MKSLDSAQICELTFLLGFDVYLANDDLTLVSINGQKENVSINIDKTSTEALHNHLHFDNFFGANVSVSARSEFIKIVMGGLKLIRKYILMRRIGQTKATIRRKSEMALFM